MSDDKNASSATGRQKSITIDLEAEDVTASETADPVPDSAEASDAGSTASDEAAQKAAQKAAQEAAQEALRETARETLHDDAPHEQARQEQARQEEARQEEAREAAPVAASPVVPPRRGISPFWLVTSALVGGFGALALNYALLGSDYGPGREFAEFRGELQSQSTRIDLLGASVDAVSSGAEGVAMLPEDLAARLTALEAGIAPLASESGSTDLAARLSALEAQIGALAAADVPMPVEVDLDGITARLDALAQKTDSLGGDVAAVKTAVAGGAAGETPALESLAIRMDALEAIPVAVPQTVDLAPVEGRITLIESELAGLREALHAASAASSPGAVSANVPTAQAGASGNGTPEAVTAMAGAADAATTERLATVEVALTNLEAALAALSIEVAATGAAMPSAENSVSPERVEGLESGLSEVRDSTSALAGKLENTASEVAALSEQMGAFSADLSGYGQGLTAVQSELAESGARGQTAREQAALTLALSSLRDASARGAPFRSTLDAVVALSSDAVRDEAEGLMPFADAGTPTVEAIQAMFPAVARAIETSAPLPEDASLTDRLSRSLRSVVRIRPTTPTEGASTGDRLARLGAFVAEGDMPSALVEWDALDDAQKDATRDFGTALKARTAVDALIGKLSDSILSGLSQK